MWQYAPDPKTQLVSCELYSKSLLGISALEDLYEIDTNIFCDSFSSGLLFDILYIFYDLYARVFLSSIFQLNFFLRVF